jgi:3-hydroxyacyl-[acyl-carrier-protein] dehydratase
MLGIKEIKEIIPHRHPFLLVDYVTEYEPGVSATGYKAVSYVEDYFRGHFPDEPIMPGVLIVEALAQVGAIAVLSKEENKGKTAYFAGIEKCKFKRKVIPGDLLKLEITIIREKGPVGIGSAVASVDGKVACQCELKFILGKDND